MLRAHLAQINQWCTPLVAYRAFDLPPSPVSILLYLLCVLKGRSERHRRSINSNSTAQPTKSPFCSPRISYTSQLTRFRKAVHSCGQPLHSRTAESTTFLVPSIPIETKCKERHPSRLLLILQLSPSLVTCRLFLGSGLPQGLTLNIPGHRRSFFLPTVEPKGTDSVFPSHSHPEIFIPVSQKIGRRRTLLKINELCERNSSASESGRKLEVVTTDSTIYSKPSAHRRLRDNYALPSLPLQRRTGCAACLRHHRTFPLLERRHKYRRYEQQ
jgi:hypothetical protein